MKTIRLAALAAALALTACAPPVQSADEWLAEMRRRGTVLPGQSDEDSRRAARREAYCRDLAWDIGTSTGPSGEILARLVGVTPNRDRLYYSQCMSSFARSDRYLGR